MTSFRAFPHVALVAVLLSACHPPGESPDAGGETPADAGTLVVDAGSGVDAGVADAGGVDAGCPDTDQDGLDDCREASLGTSPTSSDTDGDGYSDGDEVLTYAFDPANNNFKFNPLIADLPRLGLQLTSLPQITIRCDVGTSTATSTTLSTGTELSQSQTTSTSTSNSTSVEVAETIGAEVSASVEVGTGGISGSATATASYSSTNTTTNERTVTWTAEQSRSLSQSFSTERAQEISQSRTCTGGVVRLTVKLKNEGSIAFKPSALSLTAVLVAPRSTQVLRPIGTLTFEAGAFGTLGPGQESGELIFSTGDLPMSLIEAAARDSSGLKVSIATWDALDSADQSFNAALTTTNARDATIIIDTGGKLGLPVERYAVSTSADPARLRLTVKDALERVLRRPYQLGVPAAPGVDGGVGLPETPRGLAALTTPTVPAQVLGTDFSKRQWWQVVHVSSNGVTQTLTNHRPGRAYDFEALELKSGDFLELVYMEDLDGDGLGLRQESAFGTSDQDDDSDDDSLRDGDEVYRYGSSPTAEETDGDGVFDSTEVFWGSNPGRADSDGDGIPDAQERFRGISQGDSYGAGLAYDGTLWGWGRLANWQRTNSCSMPGDCVLKPVRLDTAAVHAGHGWRQVSVSPSFGRDRLYALRDDGTLWVLGNGDFGDLGLGPTITSVTTLTRVGLRTDWASVSAGPEHTLALTLDGSMWGWGHNHFGQLGVTIAPTAACGPTGSPRSCATEPMPLGADTWQQVAAGLYFSFGVKSDGSLWAFGQNTQGQLGVGDLLPRAVPTRVGADLGWQVLSVGGGIFSSNRSVLALKDGQLWGWGSNTGGCLGLVGDTSQHQVPVLIDASTDWHQAAVGGNSSIAVKHTGALFLLSSAGLVPAAAPLDHGVAYVSGAGDTFSATTGKLENYAWGLNNGGQLGVGDTVDRVAPTRLDP